MLDRLKLMEVLPDEARWFDRTHSKDYSTQGAQPHSLEFLPGGLQKDGATTLLAEINYQLGRNRS